MSEIKASKRNNWSTLADILKAAKEKANQYAVYDSVPLIGGTGMGDMFLGEAPELVDDISYEGLSALRTGGNVATGGIGTYGADKRSLDLAMLGVDALGAGKAAMYGGKSASKAAIDAATHGTMNPMRRKFMKGAAATAGVAAIGGLSGLRKAGKDVAKHSADNVAAKSASKHKFTSLKEYNDDLTRRAMDEADMELSELYGRPSYDLSDEVVDEATTKWKKRFAIEDEGAYREAKRNLTSTKPKKDPYTGRIPEQQYKTIELFSPQAKAEMKQFKKDWEGPSSMFVGDHWANYLDVIDN